MTTPLSILKRYWGHQQFRPMQEEIIQSTLDGHDTLALLPTGGGKSVCFQVPALLNAGICIVVSPLIALMQDQVQQLRHHGINAQALYTGLSLREIDIILDNCIYGDVKFLYVSPERLKSALFQERLQKMNVNLLVIDEAHCISQWGYDFRPSYLEIAKIKPLIPDIPVLALTASATPEVEDDIADKLEMKDVNRFKKSFSRDNLSYSAFCVEDKEQKMLKVIRGVQGSAIIYVGTRKEAKQIADFLRTNHISANHYHAGLTPAQRKMQQENWIQNKFRVMVATNAFGMGIDKPDVRLVIHNHLPTSMEAYYQEAGRAGRDGGKAYAVVIFHAEDKKKLLANIEKSHPSVEDMQKVYQHLANYYKLAIGSGELASFDLNMHEFDQAYELDPLTSFYAIKGLEKEGFIALNESFYHPSTMMINYSHDELYRFQVAHARFDPLIKALLRIYGGALYTQFVAVFEQKIATYLNVSGFELTKMLNALAEHEVIIYRPQSSQPQLTFLSPRWDANLLPIDRVGLKTKYDQDMARAKAVIVYLENQMQCRTQQIVGYFGESTDEVCGICDNCLKKKKSEKYQSEHDQLEDQLITLLKDHAWYVQDIIEALPEYDEVLIVDWVRTNLEEGHLKNLDSGEVEWQN